MHLLSIDDHLVVAATVVLFLDLEHLFHLIWRPGALPPSVHRAPVATAAARLSLRTPIGRVRAQDWCAWCENQPCASVEEIWHSSIYEAARLVID